MCPLDFLIASLCSPVRPSAPLCVLLLPCASPQLTPHVSPANSHSDSSRSNGDIVRVTDPAAAGHAFFPPANPTCVPCTPSLPPCAPLRFPPANPTCVPCTPSLPPCAPLCFPSLCVLLLPCASPLLTPHVSPVLPHFLPANNHTDSSRSNGDIIRVTDPAAADVFFVPFLASLSFNIFTTNGMRGALAEKDKILQEELPGVLKESPWWQRSGGRDHIIPMLQPNAMWSHPLSLSLLLILSHRFRPSLQEELCGVLKESPWWQRSGGRDHSIPCCKKPSAAAVACIIHPHLAVTPLFCAVLPSLQEELWSVLKESPWWQRSGGRDHIIPMLQPNALNRCCRIHHTSPSHCHSSAAPL
ncbi:unnamed protein product, partial [Closterium sp. NIES-64]